MDWNIRCKVEVSWNSWSLWQFYLLLSWSGLTETLSASINFKIRRFMWRNSTCGVTIIHVDTFQVSKRDFRVPCCVTSFEKRNHYILVNLIVGTSFGWRVLRKQHETISSIYIDTYIHIHIYILYSRYIKFHFFYIFHVLHKISYITLLNFVQLTAVLIEKGWHKGYGKFTAAEAVWAFFIWS